MVKTGGIEYDRFLGQIYVSKSQTYCTLYTVQYVCNTFTSVPAVTGTVLCGDSNHYYWYSVFHRLISKGCHKCKVFFSDGNKHYDVKLYLLSKHLNLFHS